MNIIASTKPNTSNEVFSRAIAATAKTLSMDIETSAIVIVSRAPQSDLAVSASPSSAPSISEFSATFFLRISLKKRQQTQDNINPPTNKIPGMLIKKLAITAKSNRKPAAIVMPQKIAFLRNSGDNPAAAMPMIRALSPDIIISAKTIWAISKRLSNT